MTIDAYQTCPCGSGKKLKFCCCQDILGELDKVVRMLEGEQYVAATELINKTIASKGPRAALLTIKIASLLAQNDLDGAEQACKQLKEHIPTSAAAEANLATISAARGQVKEAVNYLQRALEKTDRQIHPDLYRAASDLVEDLLAEGFYLSARGHAFFLLTLAGEKDSNAMTRWVQVSGYPGAPLILKAEFDISDPPENAVWKQEFEAVRMQIATGQWRRAAEKLDAINRRHPGQRVILWTFALLQGWLADHSAAALAFRKYSQLPGLPADDAVEAEAIAQLLTQGPSRWNVERVQQVYSVGDAERLLEQLLSSRRVARMPFDPRELSAEGEPPPKGAFWLLDRLPADPQAEPTLENTPRIVGTLLLYGRQTDRDARLEFISARSQDFGTWVAAVRETCGESLGALQQENALGQIPPIQDLLNRPLYVSPTMKRHAYQELTNQVRQQAMLKEWPNLPHAALDGKRPAEVAADPALRLKLQAAVLVIECLFDMQKVPFDFNELRRTLGIPENSPVAAEQVDLNRCSPATLLRVNVNSLNDDQLRQVFVRATFLGAVRVGRSAATEILARKLPETGIKERLGLYGYLAETAPSSDEALDVVIRARQEAMANGESPARWLLSELTMRLQRGELPEAEQAMQAIRTRHIREPGVAEALYNVLNAFGMLRQGPSGPAPGPAARPPTPAAESKKLWTPDQPAPAAPAPASAPAAGQKSKLWLPGMD